MSETHQLTMDELLAGLDEIRRSPSAAGELRLIVRRPASDAREVLETGELDVRDGLRGDDWIHRRSRHTPDGSAHPDTQITIMNSRVIALVAGSRDRWALAGDQLFVDLDLSEENLPPGARLSIGDATLEITPMPHTGCAKFAARFGKNGLRFVNTPEGRALRLRGVYAKIVSSGTIRAGDEVRKLG